MLLYILPLLFLIGLCVGSFLNVLIDRLPRNETIFGRSYCENCKKKLFPWDLIPVLSFLFLGGKCRYCGKKLSIFYPIVEILTGILFVLAFLVFQDEGLVEIIYYLFAVCVLEIVFFSDLRYGIIPDKIVYPSIIVSLAYVYFVTGAPLPYVLASIFAFSFFALIYAITKGRGMGMGDVKFVIFLGLFLGIPKTFFAIYLAFLTGGIFGIILIMWKRKRLRSYKVPFGPFLVTGSMLSLFLEKNIKDIVSRFFPL